MNRAVKWIGAAAILAFVTLGIIGSGMEDKADPATSTDSDQSTQPENAELATETQKPNEPTNPPAPTLSEQDQIRMLVSDQLKGKNNMKKDSLRSLEVTEQEGGDWNVAVEFNASDNLSANLRKASIETKMSEIYISLFNSGKNIETVSVGAYFPLVDQYGNENDGIVYASSLGAEEAKKVNWNADSASLRLTILPRVWTTTMLHPEFR